MSRPILAGLALRDDDAAPLALARTLAGLSGAPLALASVFPIDAYAPIITAEYVTSVQDEAQRRLDAVAASLGGAQVATHVRQGSRAAELDALAEELDAIALVVGSSHRGTLGRVLAGDLAASLLHGAPCPVAVAPRGHEPRAVAHIGVAFAPTDEGRAAAAFGFALARRCGAAVELISVVDAVTASGAYAVPGWTPPPVVLDREELDRRALGAAERVVADLGEGVRASCDVRHGAVVPTLAEATRTLDLLVCGSRGYGALRGAIAGRVSRALAHEAACPLVLVPRRMPAAEAAAWPAHAMMRAR